MNPAVISYALSILGQIPALIMAGQDIMNLIQQGQAALVKMGEEKRDPTPEEWEALNTAMKAAHDALQKA
jgi:hypothetical protein